MSEPILYPTEDGRTQLHLRVAADSSWLSQLEAGLWPRTFDPVLISAIE